MQVVGLAPQGPLVEGGLGTWALAPELVVLLVLAAVVTAFALSRLALLGRPPEREAGPAEGTGGEPVMDPVTDAEKRYEVLYRREEWVSGDGLHVFMLLVACGGVCVVHAHAHDRGDRRFLFGRGLFAGTCIDSDRDAVWAATQPVEATDSSLLFLGLFEGGLSFVGKVLVFASVFANAASNWGAYHAAAATLKDVPDGVLDELMWRGEPLLAAPPAADPKPEVLATRDPRGFDGGAEEDAAAVKSFLMDWHARLSSVARPCGLDRNSWSPEAFAYLAEEGSARQRRAQAAALQPVFLPYFPQVPELAEAIDGGVPFEPILRYWLAARRFAPDTISLDLARLKRLRAYPGTPAMRSRDAGAFRMPDRKGRLAGGTHGGLTGRRIEDVLWVAAEFPIEKVPATADGWMRIVPDVCEALKYFRRWEVPLPGLLAGMSGEWGLGDLAGGKEAYGHAFLHGVGRKISGLSDMVRRLQETVVDMAPPDGPAEPGAGRVESQGLAARMILSGRSFRGALALQEEWHARIDAQDALLPPRPGQDDYVWPALFDPLTFKGGVSMRCLTSSQELRMEGEHGKDVNGMVGLGHCVGGYARRCASGESHIVSVTGPGKLGGVVRLSTLELAIDHATVHRYPGLCVRQHMARHNGPPPREAEEAASELLWMIDKRQVTIDPSALQRREPTRVRVEEYDLAGAVAAWSPYLTPYGREASAKLLERHAAAG